MHRDARKCLCKMATSHSSDLAISCANPWNQTYLHEMTTLAPEFSHLRPYLFSESHVASLRHRWCHATRKDSAKVSRFLSSTFQAEKASKDAVMESFLAGTVTTGLSGKFFWVTVTGALLPSSMPWSGMIMPSYVIFANESEYFYASLTIFYSLPPSIWQI